VKKKKAKGKIKAVPQKSVVRSAAKKSPAKKRKGMDIVEVRENINELVKESAELIVASVIEVAARTGQLASAKYLFEAAGLYPATEQTEPAPLDGSLAHALLARMGIPTEPVIYDDDEFAIPAERNSKDEAACVATEGSGNDRKDGQERVVEIGEGKPACEGDAVE
jgi:hypothetical protein